jgi:copper chaperone CopZ
METLTLTAPDISCEHCQATIEREVGSLAGVHSVAVDIPTKQVRVDYDPHQTSEQAITTKLDDEGFSAIAS